VTHDIAKCNGDVQVVIIDLYTLNFHTNLNLNIISDKLTSIFNCSKIYIRAQNVGLHMFVSWCGQGPVTKYVNSYALIISAPVNTRSVQILHISYNGKITKFTQCCPINGHGKGHMTKYVNSHCLNDLGAP